MIAKSGLLESGSHSIRLLDVGCGCGDQSLYLSTLQKGPSQATGHAQNAGPASGVQLPLDSPLNPRHQHPSYAPLIDNYVGITLEPPQAALANRRVQDSRAAENRSSDSDSFVQVFCGNAADPTSWSDDLQSATQNFNTSDSDAEKWLLALDTSYHFRPSRLPLLTYACGTLGASFMAFDLLLADDASWVQRLLMRIVCWVLGAPFSNILTKSEYIKMLSKAGYDPSRVEMEDISKHVFAGLADFLKRRVEEAAPYGLKVGKYRGARVVFNWWAKSGVIRGYVVVARRS